MSTDHRKLNLAAAVLCGLGSLAALVPSLLTGRPRDAAARAAAFSALFGVIGSAAWAASAYQDLEAAKSADATA
ncbi:MAG: hypothetical protein R2705_19665 [Ilumatobacteraceae bacterium]